MKNTTLLLLAALAAAGAATAQSVPAKMAIAPPRAELKTADGRTAARHDAMRPAHAQKVTPPVLGIEAPDGETFLCEFNTQDEFDAFTIINVNGDANVWRWDESTKCAVIGYNGSMAMDDYLVSPAVRLEAGKRYIISVSARNSSQVYPERIAIRIGRGTAVDDITATIVEPYTIPGSAQVPVGDYFIPENTGDYHIFIHGCSDADMSTLCLHDVKVSSPDARPIPGEDAIKYREVVLLDQDFSGVGGSEDSPLALEDSKHNLNGLDGWRGLDCYGIGGAVMVNTINGTSGWSQLNPPRVTFSNATGGSYRGRITVETKVVQWSDEALSWGYYETLEGTGMIGSAECPNGWRWGSNGADFGSGYSTDGSWDTMVKDIEFSSEPAALLLDDLSDPNNCPEVGTFPVNNYSARIKSVNNSNIAIRRFKVSELIPEIAAISTWNITSYSADGFTMEWEPVQGADRYIVDLYEGDATAFSMIRIARQDVDGTSCSFDVDTRDGRFLYVNMFACNDDSRSPLSATRRVFSVNTPGFGPLPVPENGTMTVPFTSDPASHALEVYALAGKKNAEAVNDHTVASITFAGFKDAEAGDNTPYVLPLAEQAPGWMIYPAASFEDGAFKCSNLNAFWGYSDPMTVTGNAAYDFSNIDGKVKVTVTARTDGDCTLTAQLMAFDNVERYYFPFASESAALKREYDTYSFQLDPQGRDNVYVTVTTGGQHVNYIKDVKVTCDLPAGATFLAPFLVGSIDIKDKNMSSGTFDIDVPAWAEKIRITGQAYRGLIHTDEEGRQTLYYNARSPYSEPAEIELDPVAIETVGADDADAAAVCYNLQGIRVDRPAVGGVYLKVTGNKTVKIRF